MDLELASRLLAAMARPAPAQLKALASEGESFGQRLARLRRERGFTQVELAERVGTIQAIVSDYERDKLRPYADVVVRFASVLGVSTDVVLGVTAAAKRSGASKNRRFLRRIELLSKLPKRDQDALLRTIDAFFAARTGHGGGRRAA